jgi:hypothetical protein
LFTERLDLKEELSAKWTQTACGTLRALAGCAEKARWNVCNGEHFGYVEKSHTRRTVVPCFRPLRGSVALITPGDKLLVIERYGDLSLSRPGGLARPWESHEAALSREVFEETGLRVVPTSHFCVTRSSCLSRAWFRYLKSRLLVKCEGPEPMASVIELGRIPLPLSMRSRCKNPP